MSSRSLKPKTKQLLKNRQAHESLSLLLRRQGLRGLDPNSFEGQYIEHLMQHYTAGLNTNLPAAYVDSIVEIMVGAIIGQRSAFEFIIAHRAPSISVTEDGRAQRQAWQMAITSWRTFADTILKCVKELRPQEAGPAKPLSVHDMFEAMQEAARRSQGRPARVEEDDHPLVSADIKELLISDAPARRSGDFEYIEDAEEVPDLGDQLSDRDSQSPRPASAPLPEDDEGKE